MQLPATFRHARATRLILSFFLLATGLGSYLAFQIPGELGLVAGLVLVAVGAMFGHRWYLGFRQVELTHDTIRLHDPWRSRELAYRDVLKARFDTSPHDLILTTHEREYRIPRTIQGFQRVHEEIVARAALKDGESLPLEIRAKRTLRALGVFALVELMAVPLLLVRQGPDPFVLMFCASLVVSALAILDQCVFRRCRWQQDGLWVQGLFGRKFYERAKLERARVSKRTLWSRLQLDFGGGRQVTIEDQLFDFPVVRMARLIEQDWGCAVTGTVPGGAR